MKFIYKVSPNNNDQASTEKIMLELLACLGLVYIAGVVRCFGQGTTYGINAIVLMVVSLVCGLLSEVVYAYAMKIKDIKDYVLHSYGWITCVILVLCVKPDVSPYAVAISTIVGLVFGKLVYGGFGQNVFNPAGVGRAVLATSFASATIADAITGSTVTSALSSNGWLMDSTAFNQFLNTYGGLGNILLGNYNGAIGETFTLLLIVCAIYLGYREVIDWRIPLTYIGVMFVGTLVIGLTHGLGIEYPLAFISTGGIALGGVFMLTDPVTCPNTRPGRLVFAAFAALCTTLIRFFGSLPEGVVFSILLANMVTPVIEKIFEGNQLTNHKRNVTIALCFVAAVAIIVALCGIGLPISDEEAAISVVKVLEVL